MVYVKESKGKKKTSYFLYDYVRADSGQFKKVYLGKTTREAYLEYLKGKRTKNQYCKVCGKRFEWTIPEYVDKNKFKICRCD